MEPFLLQNHTVRLGFLDYPNRTCLHNDYKSLKECDKLIIPEITTYLFTLLRLDRAANVTLHGFPLHDSVHNDIASGKIDNTTIVGALKTGIIDIYLSELLVMTERRAPYLDLVSSVFSRTCFYFKRTEVQHNQEAPYYLLRNTPVMWTMLLFALFVFIVSNVQMLLPSQYTVIADKKRFWGKQLFTWNSIFRELSFFIAIGIYNAKLKAEFTDIFIEQVPFTNLAELAAKVASKDKNLVVNLFADYRTDYINSSRSAGFESLRKALTVNPLLVYPNDICKRLLNSNGKDILFIDEANMLDACGKYFLNFSEVCLPEVPEIVGGYGLAKGSEFYEYLVRAAPFLYNILKKELSFDEKKIDLLNHARQPIKAYSVPLSEVWSLLIVILIIYALTSLVLIAETFESVWKKYHCI